MPFKNYQTLKFDHSGRILTITMNRPEKRNGVDDLFHEELGRVFYDAQLDRDSDVVVLTGTGRWFSAGGDTTWFQECIDDAQKWRDNVTVAKRIINGLLELEKPIIAKVNGAAAGLGASVALMCDIAVVEENALIGDPHVSMGLVAGDGGPIIWPQLVGMSLAKEMLLTGRMLTGQEAKEIRLVNHAVPGDQLDDTVNELAAKLANGSRWAIRWTKTVMNLELRRLSLLMTDAALGWETVTNHLPDHQEAVTAFSEKRSANFE